MADDTTVDEEPSSQGTPYDDDGNLNNGWSTDENGDPVWIGAGYDDSSGKNIEDVNEEDPFEAARIAAIAAEEEESSPTEQAVIDSDPLGYWADRAVNLASGAADTVVGGLKSLFGADTKTGGAGAAPGKTAAVNYSQPPDWRFRITLAPGAKYLYNAPGNAGILEPLRGRGVIFPYTPSVSVAYSAAYESLQPTHSNYKIHQYQGSSVDTVTVTGEFTAQDVTEANYMLAVIHFLRSSTKMFYGQDTSPRAGTPPPLLYLSGFGQFQFDNHPVVLQNFTYSLPTDVDYINAYPSGGTVGVTGADLSPYLKNSPLGRMSASGLINSIAGAGISRLKGAFGDSKLGKMAGDKVGGMLGGAISGAVGGGGGGAAILTRVPTKMSITLTFLPIATRRAVSNEFSLQKYAKGELLNSKGRSGGGMW
jgi:hypothetical protein